MLNSAAGVMFPSAIDPPITTMRSMPAPPLRSSRSGDVRERPRRHERDRQRAVRDRPQHEVDSALVERPATRGCERRAVEAALAVHVRCDGEIAHERLRCTRGDGDVLASGEVEHADRVRRRLLERLVAVHGRDREQLELRARDGEQQRDRVVVARIAVEDDRDAHARSIDLAALTERTFRTAASTSPASSPQNAEPMPPKLVPDAVTRNVTTAASR